MNEKLLQQVCDMLNKECTFQSFSKWYTVKDGQIHWQNEDCGGVLDDTAIFELLGSGREKFQFDRQKMGV